MDVKTTGTRNRGTNLRRGVWGTEAYKSEKERGAGPHRSSMFCYRYADYGDFSDLVVIAGWGGLGLAVAGLAVAGLAVARFSRSSYPLRSNRNSHLNLAASATLGRYAYCLV